MFNKLCIIGVGLIGGSVAKAARAQGLVKTIVGFGREQDLENLETAKRLGVIDVFYIEVRLLTGFTSANRYLIMQSNPGAFARAAMPPSSARIQRSPARSHHSTALPGRYL